MKIDGKILVVDDEQAHADVLVEALENNCPDARAVYEPDEAIEILKTGEFDIVLTDLNFGTDLSGMDILDKAIEANPDCKVILVTAYATIDTCKDAIRRGAYDYLVKPVDIEQLRTMVLQAWKKVANKKSDIVTSKASERNEKEFVFEGVKGNSHSMQSLFRILGRVAPTDLTVVIEGESGTGKELLAHAIHLNSKRRNNAFKPINCAGLTESLLESELFGHARGAFTGATGDRKGLFEIADKGTLFLDEVGDMPLNMQAKLLRVLEDGVVQPVGSEQTVSVDVRVISATNHDLAKLVEKKKFRQDLFFRIKGVSVTIPPLRERREDIPELVEFFISQTHKQIGNTAGSISEPAMRILSNYDWPGNVRQLRNTVRTMAVMCDRDTIDVQDIPPEIHQPARLLGGTSSAGVDLGGVKLDQLEKQAIEDTLKKVNGNREQAAKVLGIGERTLYRKIKDYNL